MFPTLKLFGIILPAPELILLAGLWFGLNLAERLSARRGVNPESLYNLAFIMLGAAAVSARLLYAAAYPQIFIAEPLSLINPRPTMLDPWGAAAGALISFWIYAQRKGLTQAAVLDALTPALAVLAFAIHMANLASGSAFGSPAPGLPWAIDLLGAARHPVQLYEAAGALFILVVLVKQWQGESQFNGQHFLTFCAASAAARLFFEYFRGDSPLIANTIRSPQAAAWLILAVCFWLLLRARPAERTPAERTPAGPAPANASPQSNADARS